MQKSLSMLGIYFARHSSHAETGCIPNMRCTLSARCTPNCKVSVPGLSCMHGLKHELLVVQDEMETLMSRIDLNDNGNIEFEEFAAGMLDWRQMQVGPVVAAAVTACPLLGPGKFHANKRPDCAPLRPSLGPDRLLSQVCMCWCLGTLQSPCGPTESAESAGLAMHCPPHLSYQWPRLALAHPSALMHLGTDAHQCFKLRHLGT